MEEVWFVDREVLRAGADFSAIFLSLAEAAKQEASAAVGKPQFVALLRPAWTKPVELKISLLGGAIVHGPPNSSVEVITAVVRGAMTAAQEERPC